jgi:hypothetical protein
MKKIVVVILIICSSCSNKYSDGVQKALKLAGKNSSELESVLHNYQEPKDSLKLKAACFLIENMLYQYSKTGGKFSTYDKVFRVIEEYERTKPPKGNYVFKHVDSIWDSMMANSTTNNSSQSFTSDLHQMTSKLLIENIEYAFKAWEMPWSKHLSFEEFCEYILPYRSTNEKLESWRPIYFEKYQWVLDSIKDKTDPVEACTLINKELSTWFRFCLTFGKYDRAISPIHLLEGKKGVCRDQNSIAIFAMRAMGIPVVHEQVPEWADRSMGHDFTAVLNKEGDFIDFLGSENPPGENVIINIPPKVFRQTYEVQKGIVSSETAKVNLPIRLRNNNFIDVTATYFSVSDIEYKLPTPHENENMVYLGVFNNKSWIAVGWANMREEGYVSFKNMGRNAVYLPMYYNNSNYKYAGDPILLDSLGNTQILNANISKSQNITLYRKYPMTKLKLLWRTWMVHGKFQGANKIDFSDAQDLYTIDKPIDLIEYKETVINHGEYRYVRYLFPDDSYGSLGEIGFYGKNNKLINGQQIRAIGVSKEHMNIAFDRKFDEKIHSGAKSKYNGLWVGLDFGKPIFVGQVSFCPRTEENNVFPEMTYELFYWKDGWVSLGSNISDSNELNYENVPTNTLFLLRNLSAGKEERIFTYENGKQVWW